MENHLGSWLKFGQVGLTEEQRGGEAHGGRWWLRLCDHCEIGDGGRCQKDMGFEVSIYAKGKGLHMPQKYQWWGGVRLVPFLQLESRSILAGRPLWLRHWLQQPEASHPQPQGGSEVLCFSLRWWDTPEPIIRARMSANPRISDCGKGVGSCWLAEHSPGAMGAGRFLPSPNHRASGSQQCGWGQVASREGQTMLTAEGH